MLSCLTFNIVAYLAQVFDAIYFQIFIMSSMLFQVSFPVSSKAPH